MLCYFFLFLVCIYLLILYLLCNIELWLYCVLWIMCFIYIYVDCNNNDLVLSLIENYCSGFFIYVCILIF